MIQFGLSTLKCYQDGISSGALVTGGAATATIATGGVIIGGRICSGLSTSIDIGAGADTNTGTCYIYAYLSATNVSGTADVTFATGSSSIVLNYPHVGTDIAIISKGVFTGSYATGAVTDTSGLTALQAFGRAQNCSLNITYDQAIARGGTMIFGNDAKLYNGSIEGTLEHVDFTGEALVKIYDGVFASGGAGCGTWTLSGTKQPLPFAIQTQQVTNGQTATVTLVKCYSPGITMNMDRENYVQPSINFQAIANNEGTVIKVDSK